MAEDFDRAVVVGLEEARLWLPSHVLDEPCESEGYLHSQQRRRFPPHKVPQCNHSFPKPGWKFRNKQRIAANGARGGPGMQAVFLDSGQRSCGTGFFLPRSGGDEYYQPSKRTGCSPVLLPFRVVQALNLDVHSLTSPLSPRKEAADEEESRCNSEKGDETAGGSASIRACPAPTSRSPSPEVFLPKEWSY